MSSSNITNVLEIVNHKNETFIDYLSQFTTYLESRSLSKRVVSEYPQKLKIAWEYFEEIGVTSVHNLTLLDLEEWAVAISGREYKGEAISQNTVLSYCLVVKLMLKYLYKHELIKEEVYLNWEHPKRVKRLPMPSPDEVTVRRILNSFDENTALGCRNKLLCAMAFEGLRNEELRCLTKENIRNFRNSEISFIGKGGKEARVSLSKYTIKLLDLYLKTYRDDLAKGKYRRGGAKTTKKTALQLDLIFCSKNGYPLTGQNVLNMFNKACASIGLDPKEFRFHSLRGAMVTAMHRRGAKLVSIQRIARHESLNTTLSYIYSDKNEHQDLHSRFHPLAQNFRRGVAC